ncbi:MAG: bifunctional glutamate N-acetyltransferase/amino-acid acetyltransferase ArgJ [Acidobacteriaceae bacterium]
MELPAALPHGFRFSAVRAGIKASGNPDLALIVADVPASAAAMFTNNKVVAAPITIGRRHLARSSNQVRALVINAGNANCATGEQGLAAAVDVCAAAAGILGCDAHEIVPSSTGVIGVPLPADRLIAALPSAYDALGDTPEHLLAIARAIMTTDTKPKVAHGDFSAGGKQVRIAGVAKGAGMIHPQLIPAIPHATMLSFLFADVQATPAQLERVLATAVEASFNRISIDGDTSTNDTVLLLASGASGASLASQEVAEQFAAVLGAVCTSLARQIVDDGEGVTHVIELDIRGAVHEDDALRVAKAIAHSPLVKTAWAGSDPNWGRLLAAIGYSGAAVDPAKIAVHFGELPVCARGARAADYDEQAAHRYLQQRALVLHIDLGLGSGRCRFWTTDLTAEYVHINADYST